MRDYGKVAPTFWTGDTGRMLRQLGRDEQLLALFLITSPNANMIGLYHLPLALICHYLGWDSEGASKGLRRLSEGGFCQYDEASELVWIPEMAAHQIGETLDPKDNRIKGIAKELNAFRKSRFYNEFHRRYAEDYHLPKPSKPKPLASPSEAPCKPLRSQEQEQEQEQETFSPPTPSQPEERKKEPESSHVAENGYRSNLPADNPDLFRVAKRVLDHYQDAVKPSHTERGGQPAIIEQLQRGRTEEVLKRAATGYAAWCRANRPDPKFRESVKAFYADGTCEQFLDAKIVTPEDEQRQRLEQQQKEREARKVQGPTVPLGEVLKRAQQRKVNDDPTSGS